MVELEHNGKVSARKLHKWLEAKQDFTTWWKYKVEQADLVENKDFNSHKYVEVRKEGNRSVKRTFQDYHLTKESALDLCMMEGTKRGKQVRDLLRENFEQRQDGKLIAIDEIAELSKYVALMFYDKPRKMALDKHFVTHNDKYTFHSNRARILGYDTKTLTIELAKINKKYKNQEIALMNLDKYELIRKAVIDLFVGLGKSEKYATNLGEAAKAIAKESGHTFGIWDDKMFRVTPSVKKNIQLIN